MKWQKALEKGRATIEVANFDKLDPRIIDCEPQIDLVEE